MAGDGLRAGHANEPGETRVPTAYIAFHGQRLRFKTLRLFADVVAGQADAEARFKRCESPPHGGLGDVQILGSGR